MHIQGEVEDVGIEREGVALVNARHNGRDLSISAGDDGLIVVEVVNVDQGTSFT